MSVNGYEPDKWDLGCKFLSTGSQINGFRIYLAAHCLFSACYNKLWKKCSIGATKESFCLSRSMFQKMKLYKFWDALPCFIKDRLCNVNVNVSFDTVKNDR